MNRFIGNLRSLFSALPRWVRGHKAVTAISAISIIAILSFVGVLVFKANFNSSINDQSMNHRTFPASTLPTPIETKNKKPNFPETSSLSEVSTCKIPDQRTTKTQPNNVGFPHTEDIIPAQGTAEIVVIAVDFLDAPGQGSPAEFLNTQISKIKEWYSSTSEGKLSINFQTSPDWIHAPVTSSSIEIGAESAGGNNDYREIKRLAVQQIVDATGGQFDFTNVNGILLQFPSSIQGITRDLGDRGIISTPQGEKLLFYWGGGQYHHTDSGGLSKQTKQDLTWAFWIHEMLHSQGLALHSPGNGIQTSLANNQYGTSLVLDSWESLLMGWMPDEKVFCASLDQISSANVILSPLETKTQGKKMAIVKLNEYEAIVIESRRAIGYSSNWPKDLNGILVYRINTTLDNDRSQECCGDLGNDPAFSKWGYYLLPDGHSADTSRGPMNQHLQLVAKENDKVIYGGVKIELVYSGEQDYVKITKQ